MENGKDREYQILAARELLDDGFARQLGKKPSSSVALFVGAITSSIQYY